MDETPRLNQRYAVEVSGWDEEENFFVEQTRLEWDQQNMKKVLLRNRLRTGSMVFLRLLEPVNPPANLPVAYRAGQIQAAVSREHAEVHLEQFWPSPPGKGGIAGLARFRSAMSGPCADSMSPRSSAPGSPKHY